MKRSPSNPNQFSKSSLLEIFALQHRLKVTLDDCRDQIIRGKHGDLSDFCDGEHLIAAFWGDGPRFSRLRARRIRLAPEGGYGQPWAGGIGDDEALILFFPNEERAANFFIRALGIRRKRRVKAEVIERLGRYAKTRQDHLRKGTSGRRNAVYAGGGATSHASLRGAPGQIGRAHV